MDPGHKSAWQPHETRAYLIPEGGRVVGLSLAQAEEAQPGVRVYIHRIRRGDKLLEASDDVRLQVGDAVAVGVVGRLEDDRTHVRLIDGGWQIF